ncbi:MAG TPA: hypothetical protein VEB21_10185, partial [Terriglobales bacterium]|nr:hypothetical protein [Terriglobales bacterium]
GVFRALRKVFESFYNDNAFLERLRHRVDESQVGMAVLVNHTFVDASELANGVATLRVNGPSNAFATIVSQPGAFSVTNPEDAGLPEVVEAYIFSAGSTFVTQRQSSDRLPLGSSVLEMPNEYTFLSSLLVEVAEDFGQFHGETSFDIEFEWKKVVGEGLEIKQVRRIPGVTAGETQPVLIDEPSIGLCTFQGEYADILANYRLKTRWQTTFASGPVGDSSLYSDASHTYVLGSEVRQLTGAPASWPQATHATYQPDTPGVLGFRHSWQVGEGAARRTMKLSTEVPTAIGPNNLPIVFPSDLGLLLDAEYSSAVPYRDFDGVVRTRSEEQVRLVVCPDGEPLTAKHLLQERSAAQEGLSVDIGFYWPPVPTGAVAGYTAPLNRWAGTTISGIGAEAVELTGYFSQTYRPEHHNFSEGFVFDPHLEEGIDAAILAAWDAADIQALVLPPGFDEGAAPFLVLTRSGELRER